MKKFSKLFISFFVLSLFCLFPLSLKANSFRGTYDFTTDLHINNDSYFLKVRNDINFNDVILNYNGQNVFEEDLCVSINNINYDALRVDINFGSVYASFYNTSNDTEFVLINYGSTEYIYNSYISLYDNYDYILRLQPTLNLLFSFENKISGYYTFNTSINDINFYDYNFIEPTQEFKITGSLVYPVDNYYLFYGFESPLNSDIFSILMYSPNGDSYYYEFDEFFSENTEFLRYLYFDNQFIDSLLYEFLVLNGDFKFSMPKSYYNVTFWDLINAYVNIPVQIIHNVLDFTIFNTELTLLAIFGTMLAIVLAIKVGKMIIF